jgi:hypothetical protein
MTQEQANKIFDQTGDLRDYLINSLDAYKQQLSRNKKLSDTKFHAMNTAIVGAKMVVNECFRNPKIIEKEEK